MKKSTSWIGKQKASKKLILVNQAERVPAKVETYERAWPVYEEKRGLKE